MGEKRINNSTMQAIVLEILDLERRNLKTGRKTDKAMVDEIAKVLVDYSQRLRTV